MHLENNMLKGLVFEPGFFRAARTTIQWREIRVSLGRIGHQGLGFRNLRMKIPPASALQALCCIAPLPLSLSNKSSPFSLSRYFSNKTNKFLMTEFQRRMQFLPSSVVVLSERERKKRSSVKPAQDQYLYTSSNHVAPRNHNVVDDKGLFYHVLLSSPRGNNVYAFSIYHICLVY